MKNIVLIGMLGCGKSTIGVVLAKNMGMDFIDSDLVIQKKMKETLSRIIEKNGLTEFIAIEERINSQIDASDSVIATGGSVVYGSTAMEHFKKTGVVVYLKLSYESIEERLGDLSRRGVVIGKDMSLKDLYNERIPLYEKYADITIDCENRQIRDIVELIAEEFKFRD